MREIKFRAIIQGTAQWIYGVPHNVYSQDSPITFDSIQYLSDEGVPNIHYIKTETLGEYTGILDANGKGIYEGDILQCEKRDMLYRVYCVRGGFAINTHVKMWQKDIKLNYPFPLQPLADEQTLGWISSVKVLGNIHENPELIND